MKPQAALLRQQRRKKTVQDTLNSLSAHSLGESELTQRWRGDRDRKVITQSEWDQLVEEHEDSGKGFRRALLLFVIGTILLLLLFKYDGEYNLEIPEIGGRRRSNAGADSSDETKGAESGPAASRGASVQELDKYFQTLGVSSRFTSLEEAEKEEEEKQRRLENFRVKKQVRSAYKKHLQEQTALVQCGRSCQEKQNSVQHAYDKLESQVDRELFGVLLDGEATKSVGSTPPAQLEKKYEEKKKAIESSESDEEFREMALEELRDAYEILRNPDSRKYYLLYGEKPPESIWHVNARHGGWGQEVALGTFKHRLIWMWLDYFHNSFGLLGETIVLLLLVIAVLFRLPSVFKQALALTEELERSMGKQD